MAAKSTIDFLMRAISSDDPRFVEGFVSTHKEVLKEKDEAGNTPLIRSVFLNKEYIASLLIGYGADVDAPNSQGWTPLMIAATHGSTNSVRLLLEKGANPYIKLSDGSTAYSLAKECRHDDAADLILRAIDGSLRSGREALERLRRNVPVRIKF